MDMIVSGHAFEGPNFVFFAATAVLIGVYALIITEKVNRAVAALLGGSFLVLIGVLNQKEAIAAIDFNTIGFLAGMMIVVTVARKSGLFEYLAIRAAQVTRGAPYGLMVSLSLVTAVLSACLDNVTTVLLIVPVTIAICGHLKLPVYPYLFTQILASNIGGTATEIGDPPNILIGSATHLTFNDFIVNLAPVVLIVLAAQTLINYIVWGRKLHTTPAARASLMALDAKKQIKNRRMFHTSAIMLVLIVAGFASESFLHLEAATIAIAGGALMLLFDNLPYDAHRQNKNVLGVMRDIEWVTIFFFIGLFIVVGGVEKAGLISYLAVQLTHATGGDLKLTATGILWISALASAIIDNIPFVATMIPLLKDLTPIFGGVVPMEPVWWSLALGACLGGNGTLIGASANLVVAGQAEKSGVRFSFVKFTLMALPMMLMSILVCNVYIMLRYF
jgi:Na+/H+ antiporter NhaD/arsenite permease-like protein